HPVLRAAVYAEMRPGERARLHRRAAALLALDDAQPSAVCAHLLESDPAGDAWAANALMSAAERALANGVPGTAVRYLRRALAESPVERSLVLARLAFAET